MAKKVVQLWKKKQKTPTGKKRPRTPTAASDLSLILGAARSLPVVYWQPGMMFRGVADEELFDWSGGRFPAKVEKNKYRPLIALGEMPDGVGYHVCPCSTKKPWRGKTIRYIRKGCRLLHSKIVTDRKSYLVGEITVPIPARIAGKLSFRGQVPETCLGVEEIHG